MADVYDVATIMGTVSALVIGGIAVYQVFFEPRKAPGIVRELNEQYLDGMPLQELCAFYNRLLPASKQTHDEVRRLADGLVEKVESRLCEEIAQECKGSEDASLDKVLPQSETFLMTFAKHHYAGLPKPRGAIRHVTGVMAAQDLTRSI